jgi:hypothetical protein
MIEEQIVLNQICLGKQGEDNTRFVKFTEPIVWFNLYGEGYCELYHKRCGDEEPYKVELEYSDTCAIWKICAKDTAYQGKGQCELRYMVNGAVVKSQTYETKVVAITDVTTEEEVTDTIADMVGQILEAKAEIEELVENLPEDVDENGNFALNDNIVSCKAFYIKSIDLENKKIYLSKTKVIPVISTTNNTDTSFVTPSYAVGDMFSIVNKNHYNSCGTITSVSNNVVTYSEGSLGFDAIIEDTDDGIADYTFHVHNKPEEGVVLITFNAFAVGKNNKALGTCSSAEGGNNIADGFYSHVEGVNNYASYAAHAEGNGCVAVGNESHAEGHKTKASGGNAHAEGQQTIAVGGGSHAEGMSTQALGSQSHAEGMNTIAKGAQSHAEGVGTQSPAFCSHAEGNGSIASGSQAHAEGYQTKASGASSHTEGQQTEATNSFAHAQGIRTYAKGYAAFTSGADAEASGDVSVAMGKNSKALGRASFAMGESVTANSSQSVALGMGTISNAQGQIVVGMYNEADADAMFIVGNGTASKRKNAFVVKRDGRVFVNGTELLL